MAGSPSLLSLPPSVSSPPLLPAVTSPAPAPFVLIRPQSPGCSHCSRSCRISLVFDPGFVVVWELKNTFPPTFWVLLSDLIIKLTDKITGENQIFNTCTWEGGSHVHENWKDRRHWIYMKLGTAEKWRAGRVLRFQKREWAGSWGRTEHRGREVLAQQSETRGHGGHLAQVLPRLGWVFIAT